MHRTIKPFAFYFLLVFLVTNLSAQNTDNSLLKDYKARSIGPVVQGGRIVDLAVDSNDSFTFYVGYASGGVFKTTNNGATFSPVFDNQGSLTIGDMALAPSNQDILYVGTGEKNSSRSSYAGNGMYKSADAGKTWQHLGLDGTQHISRVLVHPTNPEVVWVAAIGALYTNNTERGVFKSTDGGKTWKKTLFVNDSTGIIDLAINPTNPNQLLASSWERDRKAWNFKGNGAASAIYSSNDGGESWSKSMEGFPSEATNGRIGINFAANSNIVYAILDSQASTRTEKEDDTKGLKVTDFMEMDKATFLALDDKKLEEFLKDNNYPKKYDSKLLKKEVKSGKYTSKALAGYFGDANDALFNTKITGAEVYRSEDAGKSWKKVSDDLEGVYFTYGYYFGELTVDSQDENTLYIYGVPLLKSTNGGQHFTRIDTVGDVHVDHHAMWVNPKDNRHVMLANDGGLYISYDGGAAWQHINNDAVGQFYTVNVDMEKPYNVYGGLQDNGVLKGSSKSIPARTKHWERVFGGDGMFVMADPKNNDLIYTGFQFGNYFKINKATGQTKYITPQHDIAEAKLRYNWRTPLVMSKHNSDILYIGAQKLYRSIDKAENWDAISGDLTNDRPQGNVPYSTITTIAESPTKFGVLYIGTDDGNIQLTKNGGGTWELLSADLPKNKWVSSIFPSAHDESTVFATMTGYRDDDFATYTYKSIDYGKNWTSLNANIKNESANVLIQDPVNPAVLYLGTDYATYVSLNGGAHWERLNQIPNAASYDMIVHPRENELVVATHGRSIYVVDVKPFQKLKGKNLKDGIVVFEPSAIYHSKRWGEKRFPYSKPNDPKAIIQYYVGKQMASIQVEIYDKNKKLVRQLSADGTRGFQTMTWDMKVYDVTKSKKSKGSKKLKYADKGEYRLVFSTGDRNEEVMLEVK